MTISLDSYYAREADRLARGPQIYGGNAQVASLRCFMRYHKDARLEIVDMTGKSRWMTHKQVALHGLIARLAMSKEGATIRSMALEAHCAPSTVSRFMLKLQAWSEYAIDVTRGRYGGVKVRRRYHGDALSGYAERAWNKIRELADRARLMLRSRSGKEEAVYEAGDEVGTNYLLTMDATLTREAAIERLGARILAGTLPIEEVVSRSGRVTDGDREQVRAQEWAAEVVAERRRLDAEEPDWDLLLEQARERWLK